MFSHLFEKVRPFRPIYLHVESGERNPAWKHQRAETCLSKLWNLFIAIVLPVTCLLIGLLAGVWLQNNKAWPLGCEQMYSPFTEEFPAATRPRPVQFHARLHHPSPYGGRPSPAVDDLWRNLSVNYAMVSVPEAVRDRAGLEGSVLMNHTKEDGSSTLETIATMEVFHQLKCLDLLRKSAYPNYEYYTRHGDHSLHGGDPQELRLSVGHCVDILRQRLMCSPDYAMVGYYYVDGLKYPVPNYAEATHSCQDFTALQRWAEERAVSDLRLEDLLDPTDERVKVLIQTP